MRRPSASVTPNIKWTSNLQSRTKGKGLLDLGALPPSPRDFTHSRQNC